MSQFTIITCVSNNGRYLKKFERALNSWHKDPFIKKTPIIVFAHNNAYNVANILLIQVINKYDYPIQLVKWSKPECETVKEEMLSAFIFGAHEYVKTKYAIKLDCDTHLKGPEFQIPNKYNRNVLYGHKWRYTKCKADPEYEETNYHWFDRLGDWSMQFSDFIGTKHNYPRGLTESRYGHLRIASFCCLQKMAFIKHAVDLCNKSSIRQGRMPIPSHDTFLFYVAERLGRGIGYGNFKTYFHCR